MKYKNQCFALVREDGQKDIVNVIDSCDRIERKRAMLRLSSQCKVLAQGMA